MSDIKIILKSTALRVSVVALSVLASLLLLIGNDPIYRSAAILPIGYAIVFIISVFILPERMYGNIGYMLFFAQSLVKCVIAPIFLAFGNYVSLFPNLTEQHVAFSSLLLIYEQIICILVVFAPIKERKAKNNFSFGIDPRIILAVFASFLLALILFVPKISDNFVTIFDMLISGDMFFGNDYSGADVITRAATTVFLVLFGSFRIIFPIFIIKKLKEKYDGLGAFAVSLLIIFLQFLVVPETVATAFIVAFMQLLYVLKLYPRYSRAVILSIAASLLFIVFVFALSFKNTVEWFGERSAFEYISQILQSYVPGISNTASIFRVERVSRIKTLTDTLISALPFRRAIFGDSAFSGDLNSLFTGTDGLKSQIVSTIGGGYYIFGALFAPAFSALFARISVVFGQKYENSENAFFSALYLFMCVQSMLGIGVYNIQTTLTMWIQVGLALWFLAIFASRKDKKANG